MKKNRRQDHRQDVRETKKELPKIQWFPGHMKKARELVETNLKLVDVVIELLDARIPVASANPMLQDIISGKPCVVVLNKADLADPDMTKKWIAAFRNMGADAVAVDSMTGKGTKALVRLAETAAKLYTDKLVKKGANPRRARAMILGIPNVGKSSLINRLAGSAKALAANKPGVTRAKQWIRIGSSLDLLDTPGILWPKFEDPMVGIKLAFTGAINDDIIDMEQVSHLLLDVLRRDYPDRLRERFHIEDIPDSTDELKEAIGKKRGCLMKGGIIDMEKVHGIVMQEFRAGKFGRITLDEPPAQVPVDGEI